MVISCCPDVSVKFAKIAKPALRFQYGKKKNGQWYWHIRSRNGEIIANGEGYKRERSVRHVWLVLITHCGDMDIAKFSAPLKRSR